MRSSVPIFKIYKESPRNPNKHILPSFLSQFNNLLYPSENKYDFITLTVIITNSYSNTYHKMNLLSRVTSQNRISLNDIIEGIETYDHINLNNILISYRINNESLLSMNEDDTNILLNVGRYPLDTNYEIEKPIDNIVIINIRPIIDKSDQLRLELYEEEAETQDDNKKAHYFVNANSKRAKERKIGYIIKKVYLWKKLYEGIVDKNGNKIKMTLQDAAEKVEISKKSLDEYLNQIKFGKYFGFDFNKHRNDKVGILRGFVKAQMTGIQVKEKIFPKKKMKKIVQADNATILESK